MAVKQVTRYEATDGTLFTDERAAQKYQDSLNTVDRDVFRKDTFEKFITTQLDSKDKDLANLYTRLVKDDLTFDESQPFFERVWLGTIKDTKLNQQADYLSMLNTIIGNDESHIKADGTYELVVGSFEGVSMTRSVREPIQLSATVGLSIYTLAPSPGGFTLSQGETIIGSSTFVDNRWSFRGPKDTYTVSWISKE